MSAPPVEGTPLVVYCGPGSDDVVSRWEEADRPFALRAVALDGDVAGTLEEWTVDCVVCHASGEESAGVSRVVGLVRDRDEYVPVVVFDAGDAFDVGAAVDLGVTQHFDVPGEFEPLSELERLAPLVERARRQRRERTMLDSLLRHISLSVYFKDRTGRHVRVSDDLTSMVGPPYLEAPDGKRHHAPEDVVGKTDFDLYPDDLAEATVEDDDRVVDSGEAIGERIERSVGTDLEEMYVATSKAPWYDDHGNVVGLVGVTRDITDRQKYEKQLERQNARLERFAQVISHDLRNPLEVAFARLEFAEETGDPEHFAAATDALDRMNALIDDVLTLARQGETVDDPESVDLDRAAADAWAVVDTRDATLEVEVTTTILADPGRLQQLLENVFRNAVDHGGDAVTVRIGNLPDEPGFFLADDGPGIPPEDRESVFDPGYSTGGTGTGLGLSIVRTIAEAHGWEVTVTESEFANSDDRETGDGGEGGETAETADGDEDARPLRGARFEFHAVRPADP